MQKSRCEMIKFAGILGLLIWLGSVAGAYADTARTHYDGNNVFAKMLRHEAPAAEVYEDQYSFVFMDNKPRSTGHMLVIPKKPYVNLLDVDPQILQHLILTVQKMARAAMQAYHADGITIRQNSEPASEQSVFHLHFHVIPRYNHVPLREGAARPRLTMPQMEEQAEKMRKVLAAEKKAR